MYVIFEHGGKQYQAYQGTRIRLEKINLKEGSKIQFNKILMLKTKEKIKIGKPNILNINIIGNIIKHGRNKKIKIIKFKKRKHYKKQQGHRQYFTDVKITHIQI